MQLCYAMVEAANDGAWWISFPGRDGIASAGDDAKQIVATARDALESVAMHGGRLPPATEGGAHPPDDLSDFGPTAMVVVIPFARATAGTTA